jgi:hypothetical protein
LNVRPTLEIYNSSTTAMSIRLLCLLIYWEDAMR